mmetsp:Transcript_9640/g.29041  ORF Transcript_9640/g.29041 Transcript_9640/m.29041 type:complete len:210 (+) Transcript_9640:261-890(+)
MPGGEGFPERRHAALVAHRRLGTVLQQSIHCSNLSSTAGKVQCRVVSAIESVYPAALLQQQPYGHRMASQRREVQRRATLRVLSIKLDALRPQEGQQISLAMRRCKVSRCQPLLVRRPRLGTPLHKLLSILHQASGAGHQEQAVVLPQLLSLIDLLVHCCAAKFLCTSTQAVRVRAGTVAYGPRSCLNPTVENTATNSQRLTNENLGSH